MKKMVGSVYLSKNNEIAIWIKKNIKEQKMKIQKKSSSGNTNRI